MIQFDRGEKMWLHSELFVCFAGLLLCSFYFFFAFDLYFLNTINTQEKKEKKKK